MASLASSSSSSSYSVSASSSSSPSPSLLKLLTPCVVLLPVYNTSSSSLHRSIHSILTQKSSVPFSLLIVDDGSDQEETQEALNRWESDDKIYVHRLGSNRGVAHALNVGITLIDYLKSYVSDSDTLKYICRMDSDDESMPGRIEAQIKYLEEHTQVDVLGTGVEIIREEEKSVESGISSSSSTTSSSSSSSSTRAIIHPSSPLLVDWSMNFYCSLAHPSVMIRSSLIFKNRSSPSMASSFISSDSSFSSFSSLSSSSSSSPLQLYSPEWKHVEDYELWHRLTRPGPFFSPSSSFSSPPILLANLPTVFLRIYKHSSNVSSVYSSIQLQNSTLLQQRSLSLLLNTPITTLTTIALCKATDKTSIQHLFNAFQLLEKLEHHYMIRKGKGKGGERKQGSNKKEQEQGQGEGGGGGGAERGVEETESGVLADKSVMHDNYSLDSSSYDFISNDVSARQGELLSLCMSRGEQQDPLFKQMFSQWMKRNPRHLLASLMSLSVSHSNT